jgi:hypothetical protein
MSMLDMSPYRPQLISGFTAVTSAFEPLYLSPHPQPNLLQMT